ncbi:MAG: glycoside hydrolase family 9 protein [Planctomycetota bacterium]
MHPLVAARLLALAPLAAGLAAQTFSRHIRIDQLGYLPLDDKVGVLREPLTGFDAPSPYTPGAELQVRRTTDGAVVWRGVARAWRGGAEHTQSGDRAWWVDFSALRTVGDYELVDPARGERSAPFRIDTDPYGAIRRAAMRMLFYQRCGVAKAAPHAGSSWADAACHRGAEQDTDCRSVLDPRAVTARDLHGGWHDAGDYNKYVNFADGPVHDLLAAYRVAPAVWTDASDLPESGNGIPDLLDEVRVELEWLLHMQLSDGSVLHKVSVTDFAAASPPSTDAAPRRYAPVTASATASACGAFAHGAAVYDTLASTRAYASVLRAAAQLAWTWLQAHPTPSTYDNAGFASAAAEDSAYEQSVNRLRAAVWMFRDSGDPALRAYVDAHYAETHLFQWGWASQWEHDAQDALLAYATAPAATPAVADRILAQFAQLVGAGNNLGRVLAEDDAYRAFVDDQDHVWGSNRVKALRGVMFAQALRLGLDPTRSGLYRKAATGPLHYLHGVNPLGLTFLTHARGLGAEGSVDETYHAWFADGTPWDNASTSPYGPPPGYLTGGVNPHYAPDPAFGGVIVPPQQQPILKSYKDWNTSWPQNSWEITECSLSYQTAYLRLLAEVGAASSPRLGLAAPRALPRGQQVTFTVGGLQPNEIAVILLAVQRGRFAVAIASWCADLGLSLPMPIHQHLLFAALADSAGTVRLSLAVPPGIPATPWLFQASALGSCPVPVQSAVRGGGD